MNPHPPSQLSPLLREAQGLSVDGITPGWIFEPRTRDQLSEVISWAGSNGLSVVPWGGGVLMDMGAPVRKADVVVMMSGLNRLVEADTGNLTVTVESGTRWGEMQEGLSRLGMGYEVPVDPPLPHLVTVGGVLATGIAGPRWIRRGCPKNLLLGVTLISPAGHVLRFGGKTVKNVTGLDVARFSVGSMGQTGVIAEATLKMAPRPEEVHTTLIHGDEKGCWNLSEAILRSSLHPCALCWLPGERYRAGLPEGPEDAFLAVRMEGSIRGLEEGRGRLHDLAAGLFLEELKGDDEKRFWDQIRDVPLWKGAAGPGLTVRILAPPATGAHLSRVLEDAGASMYIIHTGVAEGWARWDGDLGIEELKGLIGGLRKRLSAWDSSVVVIRAPREVRRQVDVWALSEEQRGLILHIKEAVDPGGILCPGRFG